MESINVFKGYGKLNLSIEDQSSNQQLQQQQKSKRRAALIFSITGILVLTLMICLTMATLFHEKYEDDDEDDNNTMSQSLVSVSEEAIKAVCNITLYPTSCFTSISSLVISTLNNNNKNNFTTINKPDPEAIFKLSLLVSTSQLKNLTTLFQALNDEDSGGAVGDCLSLFEDGLDRINQSVLIMDVAGEKALTFRKVSDIRTWISAAMTDQDTCVNGLQEMGSSASQVLLGEVKEAMERTKEFLSNSLAIVTNLQTLLDKFGLEMH